MKRVGVSVAVAMMTAGTLSGCGASSYCHEVKDGRATLDNISNSRTTKAYRAYSQLAHRIAKDAPTRVKRDWSAVAKAVDNVLDAQTRAGLDLEDMVDLAKVRALNPAELARLNKAYEAFNNTSKARKAIQENVQAECNIKV